VLDGAAPLVEALPWHPGGVQYRGAACAYLPPDGAAVAAWLAPFPAQRTRFPALWTAHLGAGRLAVFAFDPAGSAVGQQQGDPCQASTGDLPDFDGDGAFRSTDLFIGHLDPARRDVPQADLQRTLLLRAVEWLTEAVPLPHVWRFPHNAPAAVLLDGDSDSMSLEDFRLSLDTCDRYAAPFTTFLKPEHVALLDASEEGAARARGHSFGPHPWAGPLPTVAEARAVLEADCAAFAAKYGYRPRLHRAHWVIWTGWVEHARTLAGAGIKLDGNFTAGRSFKGGYVNGTGLPAWFVDEDGRPIEVFEQSTISTDDGWLSAKNDLPALSLAEAITRSYQQLDDALEHYHTVFHPYFHPVSLKGGRALPYPTHPWLEAILAHAKRRALPFLEAERWVDFTLARRSVQFSDFEHSPRGASFTATAEHPIEGATILLPLSTAARTVVLSIDGAPPPDDEPVVLRHGRRYACLTLSLRTGDARRVSVAWDD
jgi:hypothetical protein